MLKKGEKIDIEKRRFMAVKPKKTISKAMEKTGQISIDIIIMMFMLGLMFYIFLLIWEPVVIDLLFPALGNFAFGTPMRILFELIPLIIGFLILSFPFMAMRQRQYAR